MASDDLINVAVAAHTSDTVVGIVNLNVPSGSVVHVIISSSGAGLMPVEGNPASRVLNFALNPNGNARFFIRRDPAEQTTSLIGQVKAKVDGTEAYVAADNTYIEWFTPCKKGWQLEPALLSDIDQFKNVDRSHYHYDDALVHE